MEEKTCSKCNILKDIEFFRKSGKYRRGECKDCEKENKKQYKEDPEKIKIRNKKYYENNKNKIRNQQSQYYKNNSENIKNRMESYYKENKDLVRLKQKIYYNTNTGFLNHSKKRVLRNLKKTIATPKWADKEKILKFYKACPQGFHVDHIIPINNKNVCGLNILNNLQYLTEIENTSKQNKFDFTEKNTTWRNTCWILKRVYNPEELEREYDLILKYPGNYEKSSHLNKITTHFNPHFYEIENNLFQDINIRKKLLDNRKKYLKKQQFTDTELLRGFKISGIHYGYSHHSPFWIKKFIEEYNIKSIYDPCGGWGHRLLGASNIRYIYNDIDERSVKGALDMTNFLEINNNSFYCEDASTFTPKESYEAVFTCPPYFNTETYQHNKTSTIKYPKYKEWLNKFWRGVIKSSIKPGVKYFCYIISQKYVNDMNKICSEEGLIIRDIIPVGKVKNSHLHEIKRDNRDYLVILDVSEV